MAAIGGSVAVASALAPRQFLRVFGIPGEEVTGAAVFGWRLFAARTAYISMRAAQGSEEARDTFLPVQFLDQAVFWHAYRGGLVPKRAAVMAAAASGAIIALDLRWRLS